MGMSRIQTSTLSPNLDAHTQHQVYNGLDCCLTFEIFETLERQLQQKNDQSNALIYSFERGMQAPALELMERGWLIDPIERANGKTLLSKRKQVLIEILNAFGQAFWDRDLNANSPKQMKEFFYDRMRLPVQYKSDKGVRTISTNREALEKLYDYFYARPIINTILAIRETSKKLSVFETEISNDGRMRTSYNIAGTETGRWSSSSSADGSGTNLQNITPELRRMFVADPAWKLCYLDLEQAESRVVGLLVWRVANDPTYLDACESGDLHTTTARLVWPGLGWTGEPKADRVLADVLFYRGFSYRDMSKRGGHGTNYFGTPRTMARHLKVEERVMAQFQASYCGPIGTPGGAFPGIRHWQAWVGRELLLHQSLTTILGRKRIFYGRPGDDATLREAIAFEPQSVVGDILNCALWRVWKHEPRVQILGQVHDAIVFQYPDNPTTESDILTNVLALTRIPITANNRTITIPSECKIGYNWANADPAHKLYADGNPMGLVKWGGQVDGRHREDHSQATAGS
jgi:DNA polymerase I-like protein with 3'-5' exonuclease and polymerase domains